MIITQNFKKLSKKVIFSLKQHEIKSIIGRQRLKFTYEDIVFYVQIIFEHSLNQKTFKNLHKAYKVKVQYSVFMKNIAIFSSLFKFLFHQINKLLNIQPSKLINMVDTTLIEEKKHQFIHQKDWDLNRVTTRIKDNIKLRICGSKGLIFLNRFNQIYSAHLLNINHSDQNILKDHTFYLKELRGILLADKGFSNKAVRQRLEGIKSSVFLDKKPICRIITPYHYKEKSTLSVKEKRLYKRRWKIETVFQNIKHNYSNNKLNLTGKYCKNIKGAKFYSTLINFNLN